MENNKKIKFQGTTYNLYSLTGVVEEIKDFVESRTLPNGVVVRQAHYSISLRDMQGKEHFLQQLFDFHLQCREGNVLTLIWAAAEGKENGPYILVFNRSIDMKFLNNGTINGLINEPLGCLPILKIAPWFVLGILSLLFGFIVSWVLYILGWVFILCGILFIVFMSRRKRKRIEKFRSELYNLSPSDFE